MTESYPIAIGDGLIRYRLLCGRKLIDGKGRCPMGDKIEHRSFFYVKCTTVCVEKEPLSMPSFFGTYGRMRGHQKIGTSVGDLGVGHNIWQTATAALIPFRTAVPFW